MVETDGNWAMKKICRGITRRAVMERFFVDLSCQLAHFAGSHGLLMLPPTRRQGGERWHRFEFPRNGSDDLLVHQFSRIIRLAHNAC